MGDRCLVAYVTGPERGSRRKMGGRRVRQGFRCSHSTRTQVTLHVTCLARVTVFPESHKPGLPTGLDLTQCKRVNSATAEEMKSDEVGCIQGMCHARPYCESRGSVQKRSPPQRVHNSLGVSVNE